MTLDTTAEPGGAHATTVPGVEASQRLGGLEVGSRLGRYVVVAVLGAGGMGVVYAAFDPDLDRKVALKLLHRGEASSPPKGTASRLLREAQAAARVRHPNVVTVHDVGQHEGNVFVAMEFVEGVTLREWMQQPHDWREILSVFASAGEGLRAAHGEGLVHRDFKPDNVMIGPDGRVIVMDFGLARAEHSADVPVSDSSLVDAVLTRTGAMMGTPAYMAAEQHLGREADARVDQFSFCVSLYEALYGERPFTGESLASLSINVTSGRVRATPSSSKVPRWLRSALVVGLAPDPSDRYPDMAALLSALARDPTRRWRWFGVASVIALLTVGALAIDAYRDHARAVACEAEARAVHAVWNEQRKTVLRDTFDRTDALAGLEAWNHTEPVLDAYAEKWASAREETCLAEEPPDPDARICLDGELSGLRKLLAGLDELEPVTMYLAVRAAASLDDPARCREPRYASGYSVDPEGAEEINGLLEDARVSRMLGRYDEALRAAERGVEIAGQGERPRALAQALTSRAFSHEASGRLPEAEADFERAHFLAREHGHGGLAAKTATRLVLVVGERLGRHDDGLRWGRHARALVLENGGRGSTDWGALMLAISSVQLARADYAAASAAAEEALEIYREHLGDRHPQTASALSDVGIAQTLGGDVPGGVASLREALELRELAFGPQHPNVAESHENLGNALLDAGDDKEALEHYRRALAIKRITLGEHHLGYARTLYNLGLLLNNLERADEALPLLRQALEIREEALPADHPDVGLSRMMIGIALSTASRHADALVELQKAVAVLERALGSEHRFVALSLGQAGYAHVRLGHDEEGHAVLRRAWELLREAPGTLDEEREEFGAAYAETALERARALWDDGRRHEALEIASAGRDAAAEIGHDVERELTAWIAAHE